MRTGRVNDFFIRRLHLSFNGPPRSTDCYRTFSDMGARGNSKCSVHLALSIPPRFWRVLVSTTRCNCIKRGRFFESCLIANVYVMRQHEVQRDCFTFPPLTSLVSWCPFHDIPPYLMMAQLFCMLALPPASVFGPALIDDHISQGWRAPYASDILFTPVCRITLAPGLPQIEPARMAYLSETSFRYERRTTLNESCIQISSAAEVGTRP